MADATAQIFWHMTVLHRNDPGIVPATAPQHPPWFLPL